MKANASYAIGGHEYVADKTAPGLHVVSTPLGNLSDVTLRALQVLAGADLVVCEDSRVSRRLLDHYAISTPLMTYHEHNAAQRRPQLLSKLRDGKAVVLISDAGTPLVSDPGFKLVRECIDAQIPVDVAPGPTAPIAALVLSALPSDRFMFAGFLPSRSVARRKAWQELLSIPATLIVFETGARIVASLGDAEEFLEERQVVVTREMTKLHQEVLRGTVSEIVAILEQRTTVKGEITIVVAPPVEGEAPDESQLSKRLEVLLETCSPSKAAALLAAETGVARSQLYDLAVAIRGKKNEDGR